MQGRTLMLLEDSLEHRDNARGFSFAKCLGWGGGGGGLHPGSERVGGCSSTSLCAWLLY